MEKLDMQTPSGVEMNIDKIAALFPNCITEDRDENGEVKRSIDFDLLRQELSTDVVEGVRERYTLNWPGKNEAIATANSPINKTLRPCPEESVDFDSTENLFIEGDNLDALKLLQETYLGKVKMIYIDPPYNTGKDFIYSDNFTADKSEFELESGQRDEEGGRLVANLESNGRYHSDWLSMLYSRIKLSRSLLSEDGVMLISIDDNEISNVRKICEEVFGEQNFVANVVWQKRTSPDARKPISAGHEYVIIFARNFEVLKPLINKLPLTAEQKKTYKNSDNDPRGPWVSSDFTAQIGHATPQQFYTITAPNGNEHVPPPGTCWKNIKSVYKQKFDEGRFWFGKDGNGFPRRKTYLKETEGRTVWTWWTNKDVGHNQEATKELKEMMQQANAFDNPKPVRLIRRMLQLMTSKESLVLDFFAGSASTAHAVMQVNSEDDGHRKFIMVQIPEVCDEKSETYKSGYKNISEISQERIRRSGKKIKEENATTAPDLDIGFRVLKVDSSNMNDVYYTPDQLDQDNIDLFAEHIKGDRTAEDLLFQVMLDWGVPLSAKIEKQTIDGKTVYLVNENDLLACFDNGINEGLIKKLAEHKPMRAIFRDDAFESDSLKINVDQIFKVLSPGTEVKSI